jgi:Type I restriction modification DNA specificity domain.
MKSNLQFKILGEICDFKRGLTYSKKDEINFSDNVVIRANNINLEKNTLDFSDLKYIKNDIKVPKDKKVKLNSIIICTASGSKNHLGKVAFIENDYGYAFGSFLGMLTPKKEILSKYIFYNLISDSYKKFISKLSDG